MECTLFVIDGRMYINLLPHRLYVSASNNVIHLYCTIIIIITIMLIIMIIPAV